MEREVLVRRGAKGGKPPMSRLKLAPMLMAALRSRFRGSMQSRWVQRRSPLIFPPFLLFLPIRLSTSLLSASRSTHGLQAPPQAQHVFDVAPRARAG